MRHQVKGGFYGSRGGAHRNVLALQWSWPTDYGRLFTGGAKGQRPTTNPPWLFSAAPFALALDDGARGQTSVRDTIVKKCGLVSGWSSPSLIELRRSSNVT
jgi:hypothetical protein